MTVEADSLSTYLRCNEDSILRHWREVSEQEDPTGPQTRLSYREFYDDVPVLLSVLSDYLETPQSAQNMREAMEAIRRYRRSRWLQRFDLEELLRDWGRLQQVVLATVNRYFNANWHGSSDDRTEAIHQTSGFFTEAVCVSAARYDELRQKEAFGQLQELKQMQAYFDQIEKAGQHLLSDASHDIGGSLTAISGVSQLLKQDGAGKDATALPEFGAIIEESVSSAAKVLESLAQLAHLDSGAARLELEKRELANFLRERIDRIADLHGMEVTFQMNGPNDFVAKVDPEKLQRTIDVLIDYASANPATESVRIECEVCEDSWTWRQRFSSSPDSGADHADETARRREVDQLLLRRLCFIQKAMLRFDEAALDDPAEVVLLRFPLSYKAEESLGGRR